MMRDCIGVVDEGGCQQQLVDFVDNSRVMTDDARLICTQPHFVRMLICHSYDFQVLIVGICFSLSPYPPKKTRKVNLLMS